MATVIGAVPTPFFWRGGQNTVVKPGAGIPVGGPPAGYTGPNPASTPQANRVASTRQPGPIIRRPPARLPQY